MSQEEQAAMDALVSAAARVEAIEKVGKLVWAVGAAIVIVAAWVVRVQSRVEDVGRISHSIARIDRNVARIADKAGVRIEDPMDN